MTRGVCVNEHGPTLMDADYVRLLDVAPALGEGLSSREVKEARRLAVAPVITVSAGQWNADDLCRDHRACRVFGCMVVDGLITHDLVLGDRSATYLVGRGDIIAPGAPTTAALAVTRRFGVADDTRLALLDDAIPAVARRWPSILGRLLVRAQRQLERVAVQQLISQLPRAEQRIVALLWHLADRWGRAERDGVVLPLTLGHEAIAQLVGGRRPTVSAALGGLTERRLVVRLSNNTWWLAPESSALLDERPQPGLTPGVRLLACSARALGVVPRS